MAVMVSQLKVLLEAVNVILILGVDMVAAEMKENNQKKIEDLWYSIISMLPPQPRSYDISDDPGFWTDGKEILCPSEAEMDTVYEFLNDIFSEFGDYVLVTGLYDTYSGMESQDNRVGFSYIRLE